MRVQASLAVAFALGIPALAAAQTTGTTSTTPSTTTTQTTTTTTDTDVIGPAVSRWVASGFVGSNFGASSTGSAADFGGSIGYLWNNWVGGEFLAGFTPNFQVQNVSLFAGETPQVNSYMVNAIGAVPLGADGQWQPFISGGFGAVTMRSGALNTDNGSAFSNVFSPDDTRAGGDIGGGVMAFAGAWGVRADVRYFRAFSSSSSITAATGTAGAVSSAVLPGLDFWRANIGVALRW